jgi:hypothetical protein
MDRRAADIATFKLNLTGVHRGPKLEADAGRYATNLMSGMDGSLSAVKQGHKPVAGRGDLATAESVQHGPHRLIVPGQQVTPRTIAKLQCVGGGLHDVGY